MVLTFDDGPDPQYTPTILKTLRKYDVRAMFFVCGGMAADNKHLLAEMGGARARRGAPNQARPRPHREVIKKKT
ncbi:polysaccharide deacetylase family protein, partial [Streptomyces sp. NPDC059466]|uniref:polysaccharide deacetylase family protein n=1 Tax=Streptomyces sp. NPDC059466 TaxID=3346843 RepID=UPI0036796178